MARPSSVYEPRDPQATVLHAIVRDHFEAFRAHTATMRDGEGLPSFVELEFREFLNCGCLAGGFARFRCTTCGKDRLVAFSCKGRGFCPSCGGRRMAERAAHLVDHVLPDVCIRQGVLTLPFRLRYRLAWDHDLCRSVGGIFARAVLRALRYRATWKGVTGGRSGAVMVIQRFGGALNLNVHLHALVLDGVYVKDAAGRLCFHETPPVTTLDVAEVLAAIESRIGRLLARLDAGTGADEDASMAEAPTMATLASASVLGTGAAASGWGRGGGEPIDRDEISSGRCLARSNGFSLHAGVVVPAGARQRLEQVCRYVLRPPVSSERLHLAADGRVVITLRHRWADGTSAVTLDPVTFLGRLAVLVPRPRVNLLMYHGVLGARAAWRADVVRRVEPVDATSGAEPPDQRRPADRIERRSSWSALMQRVFMFDVLACVRCGGRLKLIALIEEATVIARILGHLGQSCELPAFRPARPPPGSDTRPDLGGWAS